MKSEWQTKKLGDVFQIERGGSPRPINEYITDAEDGINWVKIGDTKDTLKYIYKTEQKIKRSGIKKTRLVSEGDFILSNSMSFGRPYIMKTTGAIHDGWLVLRPKLLNIDKDFFYFLLSSPFINKQFENLASGSTVRNLNTQLVSSVVVNFPSINEQRRIVKQIEEVFENIEKAKENIEKNIKNTKDFFESYLQNIILNSTENWEEKSLGEIYDVRDGTHDSPKYQKGGYPLITSKNLKMGNLDYQKIKYISDADFKKINGRSKVDKGDILFAMIGTIGNPVVVKTEPNFAIKNVALFKIPKEQDSYFLKYYLDSKSVIDKMMTEAKGTTQKFVGLGYLRNFKIKLPKLDDQKIIVKKLDTLTEETMKLTENYKKQLELLEGLKKSILNKAFKGEL